MVYEANARMRDPVYGCVGAISFLQQQVSHLQMQLAAAQTETLRFRMNHNDPPTSALQQQIDVDVYGSLLSQNSFDARADTLLLNSTAVQQQQQQQIGAAEAPCNQ
jgi:hypothetical protein